jgi:tetratricopeptide (TPR) repeat protein
LETEAALSSAHKALLIFAQLEDGKGEADATNLLGLATKRDGKWDDARLHFQNALELYDSVGDEIGAAIVRTNLGATECEDPNGDKDSAKQLLREALQVRRRHGDERGVAEVLNNLGVLAQETNHFEEAERYYEEALPYERKLQNTNGVARVLYNLSEIAEARSDYARAVRCAVASAYLFNDIGSPLRRYADALCARVAPSAGVDATLLHEQIKAKHLNNVVEWALTSG